MTTISIEATTITIQDGAVTLDHAIANADENGQYSAVLRITQNDFLDAIQGDTDNFYDWLIGCLILDGPPIAADYEILAVDADGYLVVRVTNSVIDLLADSWENHYTNVSTQTLIAAVYRYSDMPNCDLSGAQAEIERRAAAA